MSTPNVVETERFVADAIEIIVHSAEEAIRERGEFRLSLCGGSTPKAIYSELPAADIDWTKTIITFGDERCVPPTDGQSNFRMATEAFLSRVNIPAENVLRIKGELAPDDAAADYENALRARAKKTPEPRFRHDLLFLGMGGDGHTASLFPDTLALDETHRDVVENYVEKLASWRISFTFPLINAARHVCFLVNDPSKRTVLDAVLRGDKSYPSARVAPTDGVLSWLVGK